MSDRPARDQAGHLVRRFAGSLSRRPPPAADHEWALAHLLPAEAELWSRLGPADRRHAVAIARGTVARLAGPVDRAVVAGALLHDVGKLDAGLGVVGRVLATLWRAARGDAADAGTGRIGRYLRHESIGAEWCRALGSDPVTVALVARDASAPVAARDALRAADDAV